MNKSETKYNSIVVTIVCSIIAIFVGAAGMFLLLHFYPLSGSNVTTIQGSKEVTVNENGISDAVEKIYDSVVVVETYKNKQQYASG